MQRTEGTCFHCSEYVVRDWDGILVRVSGGGERDLADCLDGEAHQLDDEEDD